MAKESNELYICLRTPDNHMTSRKTDEIQRLTDETIQKRHQVITFEVWIHFLVILTSLHFLPLEDYLAHQAHTAHFPIRKSSVLQ